jgi:hypothetical protein
VKFDRKNRDHYLDCLAEVKLYEEKLACLRFAMHKPSRHGGSGTFTQMYDHRDKSLEDAYAVLYGHIQAKMNEAYKRIFMFQNMFTVRDREVILERAYKRYKHQYDEIKEVYDIETIPEPKELASDRKQFEKVVSNIWNEQESAKIINDLNSEIDNDPIEDIPF